MRFISCLSLLGLVCSSALVNGRSICVVKKNSTSNTISNSTSSSPSNKKNYVQNSGVEDSYEKPTLEELEDLIEECEPGSFNPIGISKYCAGTYKSETCQKLFNYVPDIYDYALSDRYTVYKAGYTISLAKAICEIDEDGYQCPFNMFFYDIQVGRKDGPKISDYVRETCESPKCLEKTKELLSARDTYLLYKYENDEETYDTLKKEQEEVKKVLEQCSKKSDEEDSYEKPTLEELEDLIEECEPGSFNPIGISKYCAGTYKSETCQKLFNYVPDIYDYALSDRYTVYKAGYTISLAKAICEIDEDGYQCPFNMFFYDIQVGRKDGPKISDYVRETCESPKCLEKTKELLSARDTYLLYKYENDEETYDTLKKEQEEVKKVLEQCSKKSDEEDSYEKPTLEELEDLIEECEPGSFNPIGISKYCAGTYKSETCQKLFNYVPDIYDYALSDRYTVYKAGYTISLAKAICEIDENGYQCPFNMFFYDIQVGRKDGPKISEYVKESCESPKCLEKTKELLSARDTYLLYKYKNEEETLDTLKKEQEEIKKILKKC